MEFEGCKKYVHGGKQRVRHLGGVRKFWELQKLRTSVNQILKQQEKNGVSS